MCRSLQGLGGGQTLTSWAQYTSYIEPLRAATAITYNL